MGSRDPRIDVYVAEAAAFAQPLLAELRARVHAACPSVEETMKWSSPCFLYAGGILAGMAAFKQHASFGFWKHALVMGADVARVGMGSYGRMASLRDLPPKRRMQADIRRAMRLSETDIKAVGARKRTPRPPPQIPDDLVSALAHNRAAKMTYAALPPGQQREYLDWLATAKREQTRSKRLVQTVQWLAEGKRRNWRHE